jgi:hypothetical protein
MLKTFALSQNFTIISLFIGACTMAALPLSAETASHPPRCVTMLRVVDVAPNDVLYIRATPWVADPQERRNKLIGIPAGARGVEDLREVSGDWRLVRYMGLVGYAHVGYLRNDIMFCEVLHARRVEQSLPGR